MARKDRKDRGLFSRPIPGTKGKLKWFVRLWHEGRERRFGSFDTKTAAREFYEKAKRQQREQQFFPEQYQRGGYELVQETIDRYLLTIKTKKDQRSQRYFAKWWTLRLAGKRLNHITPDDLEDARQALLTKGSDPATPKPCSPQRVNRYVAWLRHVLNVAKKRGKISSNPVEKLDMLPEPNTESRYLSLEEEAQLCEELGPQYTRWTRFGILTGLRQMEQFSLKWADVDLEHSLIRLLKTKSGGVQYVHLNEEVKAIIEGLKAGNNSIWLFPSRNPNTHMSPRNFYNRVWIPARKRVGLACTWQHLRHTFGSRLAMSGHSDRTMAALFRHSTTALVKRYTHLSPSHLKAAVETVSAFGKPLEETPHKGSVSDGTVTETETAGVLDEQGSAEVRD